MNEKQKKVVGLGAVALAALAIFSSQTADEPLPQGFSGGFPDSGTLGGGGVTREPSLAEQLQNVFQPPPTPYALAPDRAPALAKRDETLVESVKRIGSSPVPPEAIEFGGQEQMEKITGYQEGLAPSQNWFERLRGYGLEFSPAPSGTTYQKKPPISFTPATPKTPAYPGPGKSVSVGGWDIPGIGQKSKYVSGGSSSSSKKRSGPSRGPISFNTPKKSP